MKAPVSTCAILLATCSTAGWCQSQATATNQPPPSDRTSPATPVDSATAAGAPAVTGSDQVSEIVVTAQRRSESLQNVPVAVTAVTAARLETAGIQNTVDLGRVTPGLTSAEVAGYAIPHIRGVGTTANAAGIENAVATYIDGVYLAAAPSSLLSLNNVDRIEVLKGPQGTLFGRNATGGLIQVITKDPKQTPSGAFNLSYGNYQDVAGDLYATSGLTNTLAADVAVHYEHQGDGYGTDVATGNDTMKLNHDLAARVKFLFEPDPDTQVRVALDYEDQKSSLFSQHVGNDYPGTFNSGPFDGSVAFKRPYDISQNIDPTSRLRGGGAALQVNQTLGDVQVQSITAYRRSSYDVVFDADFTAQPYLGLAISQSDKQFSEELQFSSKNPGRFKWVAGVFFFHADASNAPFLISFDPTVLSPVPGVPAAVEIRDTEKTLALAAYAQGSYELFKDTNLTFGARYSYERKRFNGAQSFLIAGTPVSSDPIPSPGILPQTSYRKPTFRVAVDHKFGPDVLGYVSFNTGFRSGGYNADFAGNPPFKPETIKAAEVGLKSELLNRRLRLNIAGFHYNYSNIQVARYIGTQEEIFNGSKAELYGFDLDSELVVARGLSVTGGVSYLHDRFTSFPDAPFVVAVGSCVPPLGGVCSASAAGKKLPFAPTMTANVGVSYKFDVSFGTISLDGNYFHTSKLYAAPDNVLEQAPYGLGSAAISWTSPTNQLSIKVYAKNLGNKVYATSLLENQQGPTRSYGAPRTYGVTAGYKF